MILPLGICFTVRQYVGISRRCPSGAPSWWDTSPGASWSVVRFNQGKWRNIAVDIAPQAS